MRGIEARKGEGPNVRVQFRKAGIDEDPSELNRSVQILL